LEEAQMSDDALNRKRTEEVIIGENLKRLLDEAEMQAKELARRTGVSAQAVSQWMTGQLRPTNKRLTQIAQILRVDVDNLTRDSKPPTSIAIKRIELDLSPHTAVAASQTTFTDRLVEQGSWMLPYDLLSCYGWSSLEEVAAIKVTDHNLEPTVWVGEQLFVDLSWRVVTLSDLYLLDFDGLPLFRWCHLVTDDTVNVSDRLMEKDVPLRGLVVRGRVVGRVSGAPTRK
jgi:transcriptional regulator with XRE-family HTH domain